MNITAPTVPSGYEVTPCKLRFDAWVENFPDDEGLPWPRKPQVQNMVAELGDRYCDAPASNTHRYHGAFTGGLLIHSTLILDHMKLLLDSWGENELAISNSLPFVAYFHDLGKIGDAYGPQYKPQTSDWHREKLGNTYEYNEDPSHQPMPHEERGIFNLQFFGVPVTMEEYMCILYHAGGYNERGKKIHTVPNLLMALSFADMWVSRKYRI